MPPGHAGWSVALVGACLLLAGYLAAFFFVPLAGSGEAVRPTVFLVALLQPEGFVQRWFAGATWSGVEQRAWILAIVAAVFTVALAAGWTCLRLLRVDRAVTQPEMVLFSLGVGLNIVSLATLALGLAGLLHLQVFAILALAACLASAAVYFRGGCESGTCAIGGPREVEIEQAWNWSPQWLWLLIPFALAIVLGAMLPPEDFDVREYHLQAPKEFYRTGRIEFLPHNVYANMPLGAEMLALVSMVLAGDWWIGALAGKTLISLFAPLAALMLYAAGRRFASPAAGIVAALVYISIPWVAMVSTSGLIEGAFTYYLLAAFYAVLLWREAVRDLACHSGDAIPAKRSTARGVLVIAGFLAGGAASTKYPGVVYCVLPLTVLVAVTGYRWFGGPPCLIRTSRTVVVFLLAVTAGCGLWFAKNAVLTRNPTYPLLYSVFDGASRTPEKDAQWQQAHRPPNFEQRDLSARAWNLGLAGELLSPLVVPLALLGLAPRGTRRLAWLTATYVVFIFAVWWLLTHRIDRFFVPAWPLAALLAGIGATWNASHVWRRVLAAFLAVGLLFDFILISGFAAGDNRYLADLDTLRVDPQRVDPWHRYFNEHADEVTGLLLVGDAQPFDLEVPTVYNTVFDSSIFEQLARDRSPAEVREALAERGISHIYVAWPEIARYRSPGNYGITEFLQPRAFNELVAAGVLERLPAIEGSHGEAFRLVPAGH